MNQLPAIDHAEQVLATFDFTDRMESGETITAASAACSVATGSDVSPSAVLVGSPVVSGKQVHHRVAGRSSGTTYSIRMTAQTSQGNTLVLAALLPCITRTS